MSHLLKPIFILGAASLVAGLTSGCAAPPRGEFTAFARAGSGYATAVDKLLTVTGNEQIDATSWTLVAEQQTRNVDAKTYFDKNDEDLAYLKQITILRQQSKLLGQYFWLLDALANADAPQRSQKAIEGVAASLTQLKLSSGQSAPLPPVAALLVDTRIRAALKDELNMRKDVIREALAIHEQLLKKVAAQLEHALRLSGSIKENTLLLKPLAAETPLARPEAWVGTRRALIARSSTIDDLKIAAQTTAKLRDVFEGLLAGDASVGQVNALMTDIDTLLAVSGKN